MDTALRGVAREPDRVERVNHGRDAGLHVLSTTAVHPAIAHHAVKRRKVPKIDRALRHHVDMALHDEAASFASAVIGRYDLS